MGSVPNKNIPDLRTGPEIARPATLPGPLFAPNPEPIKFIGSDGLPVQQPLQQFSNLMPPPLVAAYMQSSTTNIAQIHQCNQITELVKLQMAHRQLELSLQLSFTLDQYADRIEELQYQLNIFPDMEYEEYPKRGRWQPYKQYRKQRGRRHYPRY